MIRITKNYQSVSLLSIYENTPETKSCWNVKVSFLKQVDFFKSIWFQVRRILHWPIFICSPGISKFFDEEFDARRVFLDIWKAFYKVWHKGIIFRLKQNVIYGELLSILSDFLKDRKQRVTLNGWVSSWTDINTQVPQGSILGPLLFLTYINELADGLSSNTNFFANELSNDLHKINSWDFQWQLDFNLDPHQTGQRSYF